MIKFIDNIINRVLSILNYNFIYIVVQIREEIKDDFDKENIIILQSRICITSEIIYINISSEYTEFKTLF